MNLNEVRLIGGLTKDPEAKSVGASNTMLVELSMALNGTRYDATERKQVVTTTFVTVQCWGWLAERVIALNLQRGNEVYVLGELDQREVETSGGKKERKTRVNAAHIDVLRARHTLPSSSRGFAAPPPSYDAPGARPADPTPQNPPGWGDVPPSYDEPPF